MITIHLKCRAVPLAIPNYLVENEFIFYFSDNLYVKSLGGLRALSDYHKLQSKVLERWQGADQRS